MALDRKNLVQLGIMVAKANPSAPTSYSFNGESFSYETLNETLRREFAELAGSYAAYRENKNYIFSIMEEIISDVVPKKVAIAYEQFAETKVFKQGDKPLFRRKLGNSRTRAKQFITRVGLAGVYEVFKLSAMEESFEVQTSAIGGAAQIGFEEFLDGRVDFAELTNLVMESMDELIYREIGEALKASVNQLPPANRVAVNGFDEAAFDRLLTIAAAYGEPTIYCTYEFAVRMIPQEAWRYTEAMKAELWRTGRLADYKGKKVVILPQGFEDETNTTKVIDPGYAWIIPTGADTKPVKVAFEGGTLVREVDSNADWSKEFHVYQKVGVVAMLANNICTYVDTELAGQMETWYLQDTVQNVVVTK
ncbi:MAG: hypothetical protein IJY61_02500 [Candidatus Gastranaerophilales bacterium]|nr:hypothetical protein [Candidatus Gastranaerophilales bacterium]